MCANMGNFSAAETRQRDFAKTNWRRERNWDPTFSGTFSAFTR
jgi:hypothetical protein